MIDFITAEKVQFPVAMLCRTLGVARSAYYARLEHGLSRRQHEDQRLRVHIRAIHAESHGTYGSPRIHHTLGAEQGLRVSRKRVIRLMQADHLRGRMRRRFRVTTDSRHAYPIAPNHLARRFAIAEPNRVWAGDTTALPTGSGWLFLAVLLDLCSRRVVGWAVGARHDAALVSTALHRALAQRRPNGAVIHHSDRGIQYASTPYQQLLQQHALIPSMSRTGDCWDNAPVESFFSTLKRELPDRVWPTREAAAAMVQDYIESFYNRRRRHSALNYQAPAAFEEAWLQKAAGL